MQPNSEAAVKAEKPIKAKKKAQKSRPARRESTKTITTRLYRKWAEIVKARAGGKCEVTGESGILDAHHIIPRQICSGLRFDPDNGIALTKSAHKFGRKSAHKNGLWFADWLKTNLPGRYAHCMTHMDDELDCKDRMSLYTVETELHRRYSEIPSIGILPTYRVRYTSDGHDFAVDGQADNPKAAEFLCQAAAGKRIKVIKTELVK